MHPVKVAYYHLWFITYMTMGILFHVRNACVYIENKYNILTIASFPLLVNGANYEWAKTLPTVDKNMG